MNDDILSGVFAPVLTPFDEMLTPDQEKLAAANEGGAAPAASMTPEQRLQLLREWVASHPVRSGVHLDDSRESIYAGRGE